MTYYGFFETAEGTKNAKPIEFTNARKAAKTMRAIAHGNCLVGSTAKWEVLVIDSTLDEHARTIKSGTIR